MPNADRRRQSDRMLEVGVATAEGIEFIGHAVPEVISVPRSIQEILDHADELDQRFEDHEPGEGNEVPVEEYLLQRAAFARARSEREVVEAITAARSAGTSWNRIAGAVVEQT